MNSQVVHVCLGPLLAGSCHSPRGFATVSAAYPHGQGKRPFGESPCISDDDDGWSPSQDEENQVQIPPPSFTSARTAERLALFVVGAPRARPPTHPETPFLSTTPPGSPFTSCRLADRQQATAGPRRPSPGNRPCRAPSRSTSSPAPGRTLVERRGENCTVPASPISATNP